MILPQLCQAAMYLFVVKFHTSRVAFVAVIFLGKGTGENSELLIYRNLQYIAPGQSTVHSSINDLSNGFSNAVGAAIANGARNRYHAHRAVSSNGVFGGI